MISTSDEHMKVANLNTNAHGSCFFPLMQWRLQRRARGDAWKVTGISARADTYLFSLRGDVRSGEAPVIKDEAKRGE